MPDIFCDSINLYRCVSGLHTARVIVQAFMWFQEEGRLGNLQESASILTPQFLVTTEAMAFQNLILEPVAGQVTRVLRHGECFRSFADFGVEQPTRSKQDLRK